MNAKDREKFDELFAMVQDIRDLLAGVGIEPNGTTADDAANPKDAAVIVEEQQELVLDEGPAETTQPSGTPSTGETDEVVVEEEPVVEESTPLTSAEIAEFNDWLVAQLPLLDVNVLDPQLQVRNVLNKNGIRGLTEIGDNRDLLNKIMRDVEALPHA